MSNRRTAIVVFLLLLLGSSAWVFTTPLGGNPDEQAHIVRGIAVASSQLLPEETTEDGTALFVVPGAFADAPRWHACFAHQPDTDASCQDLGGQAGPAAVISTAGPYNPLYYLVTGWPSLLSQDPHVVVYSMRALTALVSAAFGASAFYFLSTFMRRSRVALVFAAIWTPMMAAISSWVNPNAWEISGLLAMLTAILALRYARTDLLPSPTMPLVAIGVSAFVVCNLRGPSPLWVAVVGLIGLWVMGWGRVRALARTPGVWVVVATTALAAGLALSWNMAAGVFHYLGSWQGTDWGISRVLEFMFKRTIYEVAYTGQVGWNDTPAPLIASVIIGGLGALLVLTGFWLATRRETLILAVTGLCVIAIPTAIQLSYIRTVGVIWQGRYALAMFTTFILIGAVVAHIHTAGRELPRGKRLSWTIGLPVAAMHTYFMVVVQTRWASGLDGTIWGMLVNPAWSPPLGAIAWILMTLLVALAFLELVGVDRRTAPMRLHPEAMLMQVVRDPAPEQAMG